MNRALVGGVVGTGVDEVATEARAAAAVVRTCLAAVVDVVVGGMAVGQGLDNNEGEVGRSRGQRSEGLLWDASAGRRY
jgi:hypothetical protein